MLPSAFSTINWQAPWWQAWAKLGKRVQSAVLASGSVHQALNACNRQTAIRFVPQSALPEAQAYEAFIFETQTVPTRDNLHDFFNGLAWLRFPLTKARLNALQDEQIQANGVQPPNNNVRGALRDALTVFDENAAFLCADLHASVIAALREHDWQTAFQANRDLLLAHPPVLFGHALLEKLVCPYKSITAHVYAAPNAINLEALDAVLAGDISEKRLNPKPFVPLPVLGVPGWWPANEGADFYADTTVFRPRRS